MVVAEGSPLRGFVSTFCFIDPGLTAGAITCRPSGAEDELAAESETSLFLLLLHRPRLIMIDQPALRLRGSRQQHLLTDFRPRRAVRSDPPGPRIAAGPATP